MRGRKRRTNDYALTRRPRKKAEKQDNPVEPESKVLSLPVLSEERQFCKEHMKTRTSQKGDKKLFENFSEKVKITCLPLNFEKVIDYVDNKVVEKQIKKVRAKPKEKSTKTAPIRSKKSNIAATQGMPDFNGNFPSAAPVKSKPLKIKIRLKEGRKADDHKSTPAKKNKKIKNPTDKVNYEVSTNTSQQDPKQDFTFINGSSNAQQTNVSNQSLQTTTNENKKQSSDNLDNEILNDQELTACLPYCEIYNESLFMELNDINLTSAFDGLPDETLKIKGNENLSENKSNSALINLNTSMSFTDSTFSGWTDSHKLEEVTSKLNNQSETSLQAAVESFLKYPQSKYLNETSALKRGLCPKWLSNNYCCSIQHCSYTHSALELFTKKMKTYSSKFILNIVVSMRNDALFVDVIMAAFKILNARKVPVVWVSFLIFFVFYITEPSDSRFLKFWADAARFYCQLGNEYTAGNGFANLLSVFSKAEKSEEWKIIEFIKLIKQPPLQVRISYELLQPVLKVDLPTQFLIEAVEFCMAAQKDVLKVYASVIPKISFMSSPIQVIELLLKFCTTLEGMNQKSEADDLKWRLREKVKSFKTKVTLQDYPFTAAFQEDIFSNVNDSLVPSVSVSMFKENSEKVTPEPLNFKNGYFHPENEFCYLMAETMELTSTIFSGGSDTMKVQSLMNMRNNAAQEDSVCERQITRIRQFFHNHKFDLLGKYLNDLKSNILEQAAKEFLKLLFQMKISLQQGVDVVRIILLSCKSPSAAEVIASVCVTLVLNLVRINEWKKAYQIVSLCQEKEVNLIKGKVFYFSQPSILTQCRIALLLIEVNAYSGDYPNAMNLIKTHSLCSSNSSLWKLTSKAPDESIRVRILEDLLQQVISKQLTETAYDLFINVWKEQGKLNGPVDLGKFADEVLILLLNQEKEEAVTLYEKIKNEFQLNDITVRAILVTLVRRNRLAAAKSVLVSTTQTAYSLPDITSGFITVTISCSWLEEEIFIMFDGLLEQVVAKKCSLISNEFEISEITIQVSTPDIISSKKIRPLCLGIINPSFKDACSRIQRVLLHEFNPPLKLVIMPYCVKLDEYSLQVYLHKKVCQSLKEPK